MHLEPTRKNEARGPVARGSIGNAPTDWDVDEIDESVLKATVVAPPDTPLQSFARLGEALSEHILGRKFWYEKPKMAESFLSSDKKIVICEANITSGRMYKHIDILDALGKYGLSSVVRSNGWEVSSSSSRLCVNTAPDYISLDAKQEGKKPLRKVGESLYMLYRDVVQASTSGSFVLTVGGDRGISSAVIGGAVQTHKNLSVIYVSAFADCNTPATSPSHEYHGMAAAHIMGWFNDRVEGFEWMKYNVPETRVAIIGIREFDSDEIEHVCNSGVRAFSMHEITRLGIGAVIDSAIKSINPRNDRPIHLSFDLSACDDRVFAPSLDSVGGLTLREARFICTTLSQTNALVSMDFVHMTQNPSKFDTDRSAQVALTLISSAVGRRII